VHTIQDSNVLYSNAAHTAMDESWHFIHREMNNGHDNLTDFRSQTCFIVLHPFTRLIGHVLEYIDQVLKIHSF
jgi:hypothetical protein